MRHAFAGVGWVVAALVAVVLMRAVQRPARVLRPANGRSEDAHAAAEDEPDSRMDDADLLDRHAPDPDFIEPAAFKAIRNRPSVFLVDIRTLREWNRGRIPGAVLIPLQELGNRLDEIPRDRHVILYCRTASRTRQGLRILRQAGYPSVRHLRGGIQAWDGPVETDPDPEAN